MGRKEVNIFGTSFLDLLSGALGAVIILFVIVPKMSEQQRETLQELDSLNVHVEQLAELAEQLENSVSQELYEQVNRQVEALQQALEDVRAEVGRLQTENAALRSRNEELQEQAENLEQELEEARRRMEELERQLDDTEDQRGISDGKLFGIEAELGVTCFWPENEDVDLFVKDLSSGKVCYYGAMNTDFGRLQQDIRTRGQDDDRYELFYQQRLKPGRYEVYVNVYAGHEGNRPTRATVEGYLVIFPGKRNQQQIPYGPFTLTRKGVNHRIGVMVVGRESISLEE